MPMPKEHQPMPRRHQRTALWEPLGRQSTVQLLESTQRHQPEVQWTPGELGHPTQGAATARFAVMELERVLQWPHVAAQLVLVVYLQAETVRVRLEPEQYQCDQRETQNLLHQKGWAARKQEQGLIKHHMTGDENSVGLVIKAVVPFMISRIAKKNARS